MHQHVFIYTFKWQNCVNNLYTVDRKASLVAIESSCVFGKALVLASVAGGNAVNTEKAYTLARHDVHVRPIRADGLVVKNPR